MNLLDLCTDPPVDPSRVSPTGQPLPPIAPSPDRIAKHASSMGALAAQSVAGAQMQRLLDAYKQHGPLTDLEAEDHTGIQRSSVIPRRRALIKQGLVQEIGSKKERTGITNTTWGLTATAIH